MQYRRLLMRFRPVSSAHRERLLDAMALLLVDLHRGGVYWGDCSLSNTLFRRDGDRIQAYLVDAETSEVHPDLSDGQRRFDLDILVENVAFGLADLAAYQDRPADIDAAIESAESVRTRYEAVWTELHDHPEMVPGDRRAIRARLRRLNDLGFSVDLEVDPVGPKGAVRLRTSVTTRRYHANELERRTRLRTLEGQARILLNDLGEYGAWLEWYEQRDVAPEEAADRWLREVYRPTQARISRLVGPDQDLVQAYCDILEHKWLLSEQAGRDVGLDTAINSYLAEGAPAPERPVTGVEGIEESLDIELDDPEWAGGVSRLILVAGASRLATGASPRAGVRTLGPRQASGPAPQRSWWTSWSRGWRPPERFGAFRTAGSAGYPNDRMNSQCIPSG